MKPPTQADLRHLYWSIDCDGIPEEETFRAERTVAHICLFLGYDVAKTLDINQDTAAGLTHRFRVDP